MAVQIDVSYNTIGLNQSNQSLFNLGMQVDSSPGTGAGAPFAAIDELSPLIPKRLQFGIGDDCYSEDLSCGTMPMPPKLLQFECIWFIDEPVAIQDSLVQRDGNAQELDDPSVGNTIEQSVIVAANLDGLVLSPKNGTAGAEFAAAPNEDVLLVDSNVTNSLGDLSGRKRKKRSTSDDEMAVRATCEDPLGTLPCFCFPKSTSPADLQSKMKKWKVDPAFVLFLNKIDNTDEESSSDDATDNKTCNEISMYGLNEDGVGGYDGSINHQLIQDDKPSSELKRPRERVNNMEDQSGMPGKRARSASIDDLDSSPDSSTSAELSVDSDNKIDPSGSSWRMKDHPPYKVIHSIGRFVRKLNISRKGKRLAKRTSAGIFCVTNIRKGKGVR